LLPPAQEIRRNIKVKIKKYFAVVFKGPLLRLKSSESLTKIEN
jgi:hypothetical protein